jgi:hypothetical protein
VNSKTAEPHLPDKLIVENAPLASGPAYAKLRSLPSRLQGIVVCKERMPKVPDPVKAVAVENAYFREIPVSLLNAFNISI